MSRPTTLDLAQHRAPLTSLLRALLQHDAPTTATLDAMLRAHAKAGGTYYSRDALIRAYRAFAGADGLPPYDQRVIERLRLKPVRTSSGVTPVTVLTKPFPCPGECIFCPNDVRMPKSYLSDEPGAQRAEQNAFDPYLQTMSRLTTYHQTGHPTDKIEIIILGGTWSFYPETYQLWFIKRIFDALHDFGAGADRSPHVWDALKAESQLHPDNNTPNVHLDGAALTQNYNQVVQRIYADEMARSTRLARALNATSETEAARSPIVEYATWDEIDAAHRINEDAPCRCVGLVVETRPDHLDDAEVARIRRLGATKVQIGFQSLNDAVLRANRRGHDVAATRRAVAKLRRAGFKIHAHWMPNLYGSTPDEDIADYARMFADPDFRPDELKVYPCSLIESAELMGRYRAGAWRPYTHDELLYVLTACFRLTPEYCRLTRVIRDIPGTDIVVGNKATNFRQIVEDDLKRRGDTMRDIRAREVRSAPTDAAALTLEALEYESGVGRDIFLQFIDGERRIAGFLRLHLPLTPPPDALADDLRDAAIIREVHVYGQAVDIGARESGRAQHSGLGTRLIERAVEIAREGGYARLAVISAVGTRGYYRKRGFADGAAYQVRAV
jgi:elongator complex protein 3